jgi:aerobic-type carbon monoxide dehydrogenase small subunit (CoxS/CutS family)
MVRLELHINGTRRAIEVDAERTLLSVLRDDLDLTGAKYGCGEGLCGACTVLIDGVPNRSCITKAATLAGKKITTIEGLERDGRLHPVQQAFLDADAMQCGYCTAGMIMGAVALLEKNPHPSDADIVRGMNGHICRCGTYPRIVRALHKAAAAPTRGGRA